MAKIDIHKSKKRTECAKIILQKKFSDDNAKTVCRFLDRLRLDNKSYGRIANDSGLSVQEKIQEIVDVYIIVEKNRFKLSRINYT